MHTGNPGHLKSFDYLGLNRYFLTFCTLNRRRSFTTTDCVDVVLQQILRAAGNHAFAILAYCFMPDHLHLLAQGETEASDGLEFIKRAKQLSAYYYKKAFERGLWQRYGFERTLR